MNTEWQDRYNDALTLLQFIEKKQDKKFFLTIRTFEKSDVQEIMVDTSEAAKIAVDMEFNGKALRDVWVTIQEEIDDYEVDSLNKAVEKIKIKCFRAFVIDIDQIKLDGKPKVILDYEAKKNILNIVLEYFKKMGIDDWLAVDSGNGIHVYGHLNFSEDFLKDKKIVKKITNWIRSDHVWQYLGVLVDPVVARPTRAVRVPGSKNLKDAENPKTARIIGRGESKKCRPSILEAEKVIPEIFK